MNQLEKRVNEELNAILEGKNLNQVLWKKGYETTHGPCGTEYLIQNGYLTQEAVDYVEEMCDTFHSFYYQWHYDVRQSLLSGEDEDFNEDIQGLSEDEIEDILDEYIDFEGSVFYAFNNLVAEVVGEIMSEAKYEQFEKEYEEYKTKLETIEGVYVDDSIVYDDYDYESVNGFNVYIAEDDPFTEPIYAYIGWAEKSGWCYTVLVGSEIGNKERFEFDNIDDLVNFVKTTIKEQKLV